MNYLTAMQHFWDNEDGDIGIKHYLLAIVTHLKLFFDRMGMLSGRRKDSVY